MENIGAKLEQLFLKAGQTHYYQYIITILFTIEFCCTHFLNYCIPYLERFPEVRINDPNEKEISFYDLCNNNSTKYTILNVGKLTSIVEEFNIYCSKKKIYFLGLSYFVGKIIGSCLSYLFIDGIGRKPTFFIFMPISIILMGAFKFMKASYSYNWIYGIYINLFFSGISNYIIVVDLLIYICENIQQTKIPYFVMIIVTGASIAGLLCSITFYVDDKLDWRNILLIFGGIHLAIYIIFIFFLIGSPMYALNEEKFENFSLYLRKIASRNGKNLTQEDFAFLAPYMSKENRRKMFPKQEGQDEHIVNTSSSSSNSDTNEKHSQNNQNININNNNTINNNIIYNKNFNEENNNLNIKNIEKDVINSSINNTMYSNNNLLINPNATKRKDSIFLRNSTMKDVYLLSLGEDADVPVKSLFGESKMKDFTPFDLLRFQSQIKNFLILTFIWIVTVIVRTGIDLQKKYLLDYMGKIEYPIINFGLDIFLPGVLLVIYHYYQYSIQRILVTANLIQFIFFVFVGFFIQKMSSKTQIIILMLGKVCCHVVYLIMYIITSEIYPILIRTKGVGFNIGFSGIGTVISIFLVENLSLDSLILYFLLFNFFSMVICYGLPNKIGTLLLDNPKSVKNEGEDEDEEDVKLGDICIENAILVKPKKKQSISIHRTKTKKSN